MISRNDACWCGSGKKWKKCHYPDKGSAGGNELAATYQKRYGILLKNEEQIHGIRRACKLAAHILNEVCKIAKAGTTTQELDDLASELHIKANAKPAPYQYGDPPYPKTICTSLNEVICHGIPNDIPLVEGDILNIDVTSILDGYYGDCSRMVVVGKVSEEKKKVVDVSYECMMRSIQICKPGTLLSEIGKTIEDFASSKGCSVVNQFVGHGVGVQFHEPPQVQHAYNDAHIPLAPGMTITIEPMINAGVRDGVIDPSNGWEARTVDGKPSAQWEHTILITESSYEILTQSPE